MFKCEVCGLEDDSVRAYRFYRTTGLLIYSRRRGIIKYLCPEHRKKAKIPFIIYCLILGWWGLHAFFWNIKSLVVNFKGGEDVSEQVYNMVKGHLSGQQKEELNIE